MNYNIVETYICTDVASCGMQCESGAGKPHRHTNLREAQVIWYCSQSKKKVHCIPEYTVLSIPKELFKI
jgi:hypothetical protein